MVLRKILFIGMPGAGKGTQSKLLVPYEFKQISTGDLIREGWKRKDPILMPHKLSIEAGGYLPKEEIFMLIDKEIGNLKDSKGYIFDGAIRNLSQAEIALERNLIEEVLFFELSEEESRKRLEKRHEMGGRKDDAPEVIDKRFKKYLESTKPLVEYLSKKKIPVHTINAYPSIEKIHEEVLRVLKLK